MKRKSIIATFLLASLLMVGCGNNNIELEDTTDTPIVETNDKSNNKDMYKLYEEKLPSIEKIFKDNGINYDYEKNLNCTDYNNDTKIAFSNSEIKENGRVSSAWYGLTFKTGGDVRDLTAEIYFRVAPDIIKTKPFKLENTMLIDLSKELITIDIDYSEINNQVNTYISEGQEKTIINSYDNIQEKIQTKANYIIYSITVTP